MLHSFFQNFSQQIILKSRIDFRWIIVIIVLIYFATLLILGKFLGDYSLAWSYMGGPSKLKYSFFDLRIFTASMDCVREGKDPLIEGTCKFLWSYPRVSYIFQYTGVSESHTLAIGISFIVLFYLATFCFIGKINFIQSIFYISILLSPSTMFGLQRGNFDVLNFIMLAIALSLFSNKTWRYLSYIIIFILSLIKLYPIVGFVISLKESMGKFLAIFSIAIISFVVFVIINISELKFIASVNSRGSWGSHGIFVYVDWIKELSQNYIIINTVLSHSFIYVMVVSIVLGSYMIARRSKNLYFNTKFIASFRLAASIYVGTFLIGYNFDYRLIFLLFALPQMFEWVGERNFHGNFTMVSLILICLCTNNNFIFNFFKFPYGYFFVFSFEEMMTWILFGYMTWSMFITLPDWLKIFLGINKTVGMELRQ